MGFSHFSKFFKKPFLVKISIFSGLSIVFAKKNRLRPSGGNKAPSGVGSRSAPDPNSLRSTYTGSDLDGLNPEIVGFITNP